jgi:hypothetical protein
MIAENGSKKMQGKEGNSKKDGSLLWKGKCGAHFVRKHRNLELKTRFTCEEVTSRK